MRLELDPTDVQPLIDDQGEPVTHAVVQADGSLLVRVGGVTLGQPAEIDGKLVFDHDFPAAALARIMESDRFPAAAKARLEEKVWPDGRPR